MLPKFQDKEYFKAEKIYPTDRFLEKTMLWILPSAVTPNYLTILRIVLTPFVVWFLYYQNYTIGVPLFLFAALTDALDGAMARTQGKITAWGRMFDPFADKLLVSSVILLLVYFALPLWLAIMIITSELALIFAALVWFHHGRLVQANVWGKIKMILQIVGLGGLLFSAWLGWPLQEFASISLVISLFFSVMSFTRYGG